jgi:peptidoglycan/LPS O-acetylase OafA/YrhL
VLLFAAAQRSVRLQRLLAARPLLFAGFVSYPLYLLHNELGVGLIATAAPALSPLLRPFLPLIMIALMLSLAWLVARHLEPRAAALLRPLLSRFIPPREPVPITAAESRTAHNPAAPS